MKNFEFDVFFGLLCICTALIGAVLSALIGKPITIQELSNLMLLFALGSARLQVNKLENKLKGKEDE